MTDDTWTPAIIAQMFLEVMPRFGRLIALHMRDVSEDEMTAMQVGLLVQLGHEQLTTSDLAKRRKVSLQSMSVQIQSLVEKDWVIRIANPNDRRQFILQVTPTGLERMMAARSQITGILAEVLSDLAPPELSAAQTLLPALDRLLKQHMNSDCPPDK